jgi:hypothetical protein
MIRANSRKSNRKYTIFNQTTTRSINKSKDSKQDLDMSIAKKYGRIDTIEVIDLIAMIDQIRGRTVMMTIDR